MSKILESFQENIKHYLDVMSDKTISLHERRLAKIRMEELELAKSIVIENGLSEIEDKAKLWDDFVNQATNQIGKVGKCEF